MIQIHFIKINFKIAFEEVFFLNEKNDLRNSTVQQLVTKVKLHIENFDCIELIRINL